MLSRSQVAVYPVEDTRGLMVAPMLSATQSDYTMNRKPDRVRQCLLKMADKYSERARHDAK